MSGRPAMRHHAIAVAAPRDLLDSPAPLLLDREGSDFVPAMLAELAAPDGRTLLLASRAAARDQAQRLKLFQPIQRRFHLALIEAWCRTPGTPRLDPASVDAAGLVVRRLRSGVVEGWMRAGDKLRGWLPVDHLGADGADPLPAVRGAAKATGVASLDRLLRAADGASDAAVLEEDVVPMFVAPPAVCASAGRTVYYGVVPTASNENARAPDETAALVADFGAGSERFVAHLVQPLRGLQFDFPTLPAGARFFDRGFQRTLNDKAREDAPPPADVPGGPRAAGRFWIFKQLLHQIAVEFDAFGDGAESKALLARLETITLTFPLQPGEVVPRTIQAGTFLRDAVRVLLDEGAGSVEMPWRWPSLGNGARRQLHAAMSASMRSRFDAVRGRPGRFDAPGARYVVRAFVRLKPRDGCPARTVWTGYSEPFVIAPWYEGGGGDPVQVPLPDLSDRNLLRSLKPNVSFVVPEALADLLQSDGADLLEGKRSGGGGLGIDWICSFSIPIITFCAFIVLNIFLSLFDLFFRWLLFIKVCIPFPKREDG
jgi:hypothetical protein